MCIEVYLCTNFFFCAQTVCFCAFCLVKKQNVSIFAANLEVKDNTIISFIYEIEYRSTC